MAFPDIARGAIHIVRYVLELHGVPVFLSVEEAIAAGGGGAPLLSDAPSCGGYSSWSGRRPILT